MKRGDIVVIVAHGKLGRPRPAVIVQADELGDATTTMLVCPITSDVTEKLPIRPIVEVDEGNGLRIRSQIMTDKMLALRSGCATPPHPRGAATSPPSSRRAARSGP